MDSDKWPTAGKKITHQYHEMYQRYLAPFIRERCSQLDADPTPRVRFLEIGLGCGMEAVRGKPGGGVAIWRTIFPPPFVLELYVFEFAASCAQKWELANPGLVTKVLTGDQSNVTDLDRAYAEAGSAPFDFIVDDGSHVSDHQITTLLHAHKQSYLKQTTGVYFIEDIQGSCTSWPVMGGNGARATLGSWSKDGKASKTGTWVRGTPGCMQTDEGKPTLFAKLVEWQTLLAAGSKTPFTHVWISFGRPLCFSGRHCSFTCGVCKGTFNASGLCRGSPSCHSKPRLASSGAARASKNRNRSISKSGP